MGNNAGAAGLLFGVGSIIVLPIISMGILGFIVGLIVAVVFNLVSGAVGGLEVEVD